jgi:hypothetical protein
MLALTVAISNSLDLVNTILLRDDVKLRVDFIQELHHLDGGQILCHAIFVAGEGEESVNRVSWFPCYDSFHHAALPCDYATSKRRIFYVCDFSQFMARHLLSPPPSPQLSTVCLLKLNLLCAWAFFKLLHTLYIPQCR